MASLLNHKSLGHFFILVVYSFLIFANLFFENNPTIGNSHIPLLQWIFQFIKSIPTVLQKVLFLLLNFAFALYFNRICEKYFDFKESFVPALFFITVNALFLNQLYFTTVFLIIPFVLLFFENILSFSIKEELAIEAFYCGIITAILTYIDNFYVSLFFIFFIGLNLMSLVNFRYILAFMLGVLSFLFFHFSYQFLNDIPLQLGYFNFSNLFKFNFENNTTALIKIGAVILAVLIAFLKNTAAFTKIDQRIMRILMVFSIVVFALTIFISSNSSITNWMIIAIPAIFYIISNLL